jgi:hypothetical protein
LSFTAKSVWSTIAALMSAISITFVMFVALRVVHAT